MFSVSCVFFQVCCCLAFCFAFFLATLLLCVCYFAEVEIVCSSYALLLSEQLRRPEFTGQSTVWTSALLSVMTSWHCCDTILSQQKALPINAFVGVTCLIFLKGAEKPPEGFFVQIKPDDNKKKNKFQEHQQLPSTGPTTLTALDLGPLSSKLQDH